MSDASSPPQRLPYEGLRVVEFTHMVMGPTCGMGSQAYLELKNVEKSFTSAAREAACRFAGR